MTAHDPVRDLSADNNAHGWRSLLMMAGGALMMSACAGAGMAPVVDRSTAAATGQPAADSSAGRASAGSEAADTDWTAKVRPLGNAGSTASRELPSEATPPAPALAPASAVASPSSVNPAVVSLLNTANAQSRAGDYARAAATLERAIAIEPNNAWLWHRLADTRIKEGRLEQAAGLAAKSNALASADRSLQVENWKLIAEVRRRQGDAGAAAAAESQAAKLAN